MANNPFRLSVTACRQVKGSVRHEMRRGMAGTPAASRISNWDVLSILLVPLVGPVALYIWGTDSHLATLWAFILGPIVYLVLGMAVSSFKTARIYARSTSPDREDLAKRLHDTKVASLFFLAIFEGAACLYAVVPEKPIGVLLFAFCFYVPYVVCAVLWLKYLSRLQAAERPHAEVTSKTASSEFRGRET